MKSSHWIMAGVVALALGCAGPAFAEHEKGHHEGGGKWRHGGAGCQMPPGKRALVHEALQKARKENEALMKQAHERHAALNKALGAKKFSQQAFLKAYDALASL